MAKKTGYTTIEGLNKALKAFPAEAKEEMRAAAVVISKKVASKASSEATSQGGVAALVAPTIRPGSARTPAVFMGSARKLPADNRKRLGDRQTIGDVIWGAEYGGQRRRTTQQFLPWRGSSTGAGYFLWPTVREMNDDIANEYSHALLDALNKID